MSTIPIAALNTIRNNNWKICGKVVAKSEMKHWEKETAKGCFFNFVVADSTGTIKVIAFNQQCERFFPTITMNNIYHIKGTVKNANKQYMELNNAYEIHLSSNAQVTLAENVSVQEPEYQFIKIAELLNAQVNELINIQCIVKRIDDLQEYGTDKINYKRTLGLIDDSECEIELTLWNEKAQKLDCKEGSVIVGKRLKVSSYAGKNLMAIDVSDITVNPDIPEVTMLKDWFFKNGNAVAKCRLTLEPKKLDLQAIKRIKVSMNVNCDATLVQVIACNFYESCPEGCNKKLNEELSGLLYCNTCKKTMMEGNQKLVVKVKIADFTSNVYLTIYNEIIEKLLNCKADQLLRLKMENEDDFDAKLNNTLLLNAYAFEIKIKMITRDGLLEPDYSAHRISQRTTSCYQLINEINNLITELDNL